MSDRAMLLTPPGAAAIAVIRIAGSGVPRFLARHFSKPTPRLRAVHGELRDGENVLDDPVIVVGGDGAVVDINVHGGLWVVEAMLELLAREGFVRVDAADEMLDAGSTIEREMLASLPLATTEAGVRMLLAQPATWASFIASRPSPDAIAAVLDDVCLDRLLHPPRVAIVGPPNVGKSTLANQLFAQQRSITADVPGTTRDWVGEIANLDGVPVMLIDTPGVRETDDAIERTAIDRSRAVVGGADLVVNVIAPAGDPPRIIGDASDDGITVLNKFDVLRERGFAPAGDAICTVAPTGEGIEWLRAAMRTRLGCRDLTPNRPRCWTDRQREILRRAMLADPPALAEM